MIQLPARIGKYELQEFLGGGMSHVYRAVDTVIGRTVAVKILTEAGCQDADAKARFLQEARMAGNIAHDNVISIYDFGEDDQKRPFMVMEFLRGEDLRHAIKNGHTGDLRNRLSIALQTARALEYIHTQKIVHRDIKPENVHITPAGAVKLMDFGIAKTEGLSMTRTGFVLGTPYYMAPEQVMGKDITDLVDVYAFGVLLFELVAGTKPVAGDSVERIFYSILHEPLNLEPLRQAGTPEPVCELIARCTAKDPAARPQGFGPVCESMEQVLAEMDSRAAPTMAAPAPAPAPPARPWLAPAATVAVLVAAVALYFALRGGSRGEVSPEPALPRVLSTSTGEMVLVPAGPFLFGEKKDPVPLPAFYIDRTEVSNAAYAAFVKATNHPLPEGFAADKPDLPVVNVTIMDAQQFARWAGKRLPTSREWEKAARGTDGRTFPWGEQADASRANVGNPSGAPGPVNAFPQGASPFGAVQMVGNVWELVQHLSTPGPRALETFATVLKPPPGREEPWYTIRGESFSEPLAKVVLYDSTTVPARWRRENIGFRCVKDP